MLSRRPLSCLKYYQKKPRFIFIKINGHIIGIIYSKYYTHWSIAWPGRSFTRPRTINRGHTVTSTITDWKEEMSLLYCFLKAGSVRDFKCNGTLSHTWTALYICNDLHINLYYKNNVFYKPFFSKVKELASLIHLYAEACVAERLTPRTLDLEVRGSSLARRVFSLDMKLYSTLSL